MGKLKFATVMNLLEALKSSDRETQDAAFSSLKNLVYPTCHRRLSHSFPQWVDDAVMEAMGKIFGQVDKIKSDEELEIIAKRTAMNCAVSQWRELMTKKRGENQLESSDQLREERGDSYLTSDQAPKGHIAEHVAAPFAPSSKSNHLANLDAKDILTILETLQQKLKPEHKQALQDVLEGMSYEEISQKRGWPMGTVCVYVKRGVEAMREQRKKNPELTKEALEYMVKMLL